MDSESVGVGGRVQAGEAVSAQETTTASQEYAKAGIGIVAGVALALAVEVWALFDLGFIRLKDPMDAEKAVAAAYWNEVYVRAEVCPIDEMNGEGP